LRHKTFYIIVVVKIQGGFALSIQGEKYVKDLFIHERKIAA